MDGVASPMTRHFSYVNSSSSAIIFWLEPWAEEFEIPAEGTLELEVRGPSGRDNAPVFEQTEDLLILYAGPRSTVRLFLNGRDVSGGSADIKTPGGMHPRRFLKIVLGD